MSLNILEAVKKYISPDLISKASTFLGESDNAVSKALAGILPTVLGGLISKSTSGNAGAEEVFSMAKESDSNGFLGNIGNAFSDGGGFLNKGTDLLKNIFGNKADGIIDTISGYAGIKKSSATSLMSMAAPAALGTLGKHASERGLNASGLTDLMSSQKNGIMNMLPGGLNSIAGMIGIGGISNTISSATSGAKKTLSVARDYAEEVVPKTAGVKRWLLPLIILAGAIAAIIYFSKGCNNKTGSNGGPVDTSIVVHPNGTIQNTNDAPVLPSVMLDSVSGLVSYDLGHDVEFTLPNGVKFMAAESGFESQLLSFIQNGTIDTVNKSANWYNMFDVQFKSGGNEYNGKAEAQLKNCAAILNAYPLAKIKLGGYTDNTGSAEANIKVSQLRADKVKTDLIKMGAGADQIAEAVGYGPEYPICEANDTKECQARNRRVACKVAIK